METFSALLALCAGNSPVPVNSPHKGQWRGALMFSFIYAWINDWVNNREAGDLRRLDGHYDVIVMMQKSTASVSGCVQNGSENTKLCYWIARPAKPGVQPSNNSFVSCVALSLRTHNAFLLLSHTCYIYEIEMTFIWCFWCTFRYILSTWQFVLFCSWILAKHLKGRSVVTVGRAVLLRLWQDATPLWRHGVGLHFIRHTCLNGLWIFIVIKGRFTSMIHTPSMVCVW